MSARRGGWVVVIDKLELFHLVASAASPTFADKKRLTSIDVSFRDTDYDSLDIIMIAIFMSEIYGLSEEDGKALPMASPAEMYRYLEEHKTREVDSLEAVGARIK